MSQRRTKKSWKIVTAEEGNVMGTTESRTEKRRNRRKKKWITYYRKELTEP